MPKSLVDLPVESSTAPGWDEARRIQAALDAERGARQIYRVRAGGRSDGKVVLDLFAPLPSWAERYVELVGLPVTKFQGALFSYRVPQTAIGDVERFLSTSLWMTAVSEREQR